MQVTVRCPDTVCVCVRVHAYSGKYYLIDPQTGLLYHDAPLSEWPHLVGRVDTARGTVSALGQDAATKFFTQLDAYLKDSKVRVCVCVCVHMARYISSVAPS